MDLSSVRCQGAFESEPRHCCILVVEDELFVRMMISDELRDAGYKVLEAFNGDEAVDLLNAGADVDLIFSDVRMPGSIDGLGLLAFVRRNYPALPLILSSGHLDPILALEGGARKFLPKPYLVEFALRLIKEELEKIQ